MTYFESNYRTKNILIVGNVIPYLQKKNRMIHTYIIGSPLFLFLRVPMLTTFSD